MSRVVDWSRLFAVVAAALVLGASGCDSPQGPGELEGPQLARELPAGGFESIDGGDGFTCALDGTGRAFCWGANDYGELGDAGVEPSTTPVPVSGDLRFASIGVAGDHVCALTWEGRAYCWGLGSAGELGTGNDSDLCVVKRVVQGEEKDVPLECSRVPRPVETEQRFVAISAGWAYTCALTAAGGAWCWGWDANGQLGSDGADVCFRIGPDGRPSPCSRTPVPVLGDHPFGRITSGFWNTCGVTEEHRILCWGVNLFGLFGNGTRSFAPQVEPVPGAEGVDLRELSQGASHACGIALDGRAYCWGLAQSGELGDGTFVDAPALGHAVPEPVAGDGRYKQLTTQPENDVLGFTCGLRVDDRAECWGSNRSGQLGSAPLDDECILQNPLAKPYPCSSVPVPVLGDHRFRALGTGLEHTCGVTVDGQALCWGNNDRGQLGDGTTENRGSPVPVHLAD